MSLETLAAALLATAGAWLLGAVLLQGRRGRWTPAERGGLALSGMGFLVIAGAARWLQPTGGVGEGVALAGTLVAMRGMYLLLKARAARRAAETPRTPE